MSFNRFWIANRRGYSTKRCHSFITQQLQSKNVTILRAQISFFTKPFIARANYARQHACKVHLVTYANVLYLLLIPFENCFVMVYFGTSIKLQMIKGCLQLLVWYSTIKDLYLKKILCNKMNLHNNKLIAIILNAFVRCVINQYMIIKVSNTNFLYVCFTPSSPSGN